MTKVTAAPHPDMGASLDWETIRGRLARAEQDLRQLRSAPSPEEERSILKARARSLAREGPAGLAPEQYLELIKFRLAAETYGIESAFVREVHPLKDFTPLPGTPPFVLGIINVRGQIVSVVDLKLVFNLPNKGLGELNKVIIIRDRHMELSILADDILGAHPIALADIHPAPPTVTGIGAQYLRGVSAEGVIILDAQRILADEKIVVHQEVE